jgi:exonuclease III
MHVRGTSVGASTTCWCPGTLRNKVRAADIHPEVMGSDHCPVSITLDID